MQVKQISRTTGLYTPLKLMLAGALLGLSGSVLASVSVDEGLNACIQAAKQRHQGLVTQWDINKGPAGVDFDITMLTPDDTRWHVDCRGDGKIDEAKQLFGGASYSILSSRKTVNEMSARATAVGVYNNATMVRMTYTVSGLGKAYYHYYLATPDGRYAQIDVNAESGQVDSTRSERGSSWW